MSDVHRCRKARQDRRLVPPGAGLALALFAGGIGAMGAVALGLTGAGVIPVLLAWLVLPPLVLALLIGVLDRRHGMRQRPRLTTLRESRDHG